MSAFYAGLAEIFEIDESEITPDLDLSTQNWDSLAVVSTIALIDEVYGQLVDGQALAKAATVAEIDALVALAKAA
jgi:acyl carrier protein